MSKVKDPCVGMNRHEKAFYNRLPQGLSHADKLEFMSKLGPKFEQLPPATRDRFHRQAHRERRSLFIVRRGRKLEGFPSSNATYETLTRLGHNIVAEITLLKCG